ncbi:MAG: molybdopterin cofactor-binding domain-containing protein [Gammaproteobacteria bacterium]
MKNHPAEATQNRRDFLKTSAVAAGGLLIGISLEGCSEKPVSVAPTLDPGVQQNAWLAISSDNRIIFYCGQSEMGQGVYTALPTLLAEELEVPVARIEVVAGPAGEQFINDLLGTQVTGGSTSVRDAWIKLRRAGAEARLRLIEAAAQYWSVPAAQLIVDDGYVADRNGERLSYGELAESAASLSAPAEIPLKPVTMFTQIGKQQRRLDTFTKTTGQAEYGLDVRRPRQVPAAIALCPVLGGRLVNVDIKKARLKFNVIDVIPLDNAVVVVGKNWWEASKARDLLEIEWDTTERDKIDNQSIMAGLQQAAANNMADARVARSDGVVDAALATATERVEVTYELPMLAHATLEPQNCTAEFIGDELHVYVPTQVQLIAQATAAAAAGIPPEKVHIHTTMLGGGFGRRLEVDVIPAAVAAAREIGKPVQVIWDRENDMTHDYYRPPALDLCSAGFDRNGNLSAWKLDLVGPSITARWAPAAVEQNVDPFAVEAAANYPYDVPNVQVRFLRHEIGIDVGYWRSVSHATNCFVVESFMDELADFKNTDPYEFRRDLLEDGSRWKNVLELAAEKAGWGEAPAGRYHGIALMEGYNTYMAQVAEISVTDGRLQVHKITCVTDCGQVVNPGIVEAQIQGSIIFGLSAALWGEINILDGQVQETNFDTMRILRNNEIPEIDIHVIPSDADPGGMGEPGTALVAPALCNAIFAATGDRLRSLPVSSHGLI